MQSMACTYFIGLEPWFSPKELREIERLVSLNRAILLKAWEEFHGQPWRAGHRHCLDRGQADR
jgi:hypothetical protein